MKKKELKELLKRLDKRAKKIYDIKLKYKTYIDIKSSKTIGYFSIRNNENAIHFNEKIFKSSSLEEFKEIIIHEYAHMIVYNIYGYVQAHGSQWKSVMRSLGQNNPSSTTSTFKYIKKKDSDILIECDCGKRYISANRATRMKNGTRYFCRSCSKKLKFV